MEGVLLLKRLFQMRIPHQHPTPISNAIEKAMIGPASPPQDVDVWLKPLRSECSETRDVVGGVPETGKGCPDDVCDDAPGGDGDPPGGDGDSDIRGGGEGSGGGCELWA